MQEYIVSARKYRPDTFESVVAQKSLTTTLKNAIAIGKTTVPEKMHTGIAQSKSTMAVITLCFIISLQIFYYEYYNFL